MSEEHTDPVERLQESVSRTRAALLREAMDEITGLKADRGRLRTALEETYRDLDNGADREDVKDKIVQALKETDHD